MEALPGTETSFVSYLSQGDHTLLLYSFRVNEIKEHIPMHRNVLFFALLAVFTITETSVVQAHTFPYRTLFSYLRLYQCPSVPAHL